MSALIWCPFADEDSAAIVELRKRFMNSSRTVLSAPIVSGERPSDRQPSQAGV